MTATDSQSQNIWLRISSFSWFKLKNFNSYMHAHLPLQCPAVMDCSSCFLRAQKKKKIPNLHPSPLHKLWKVCYRAIPVPQMIFHYSFMNIPICTYFNAYILKVSTFFLFIFVCIYIHILLFHVFESTFIFK